MYLKPEEIRFGIYIEGRADRICQWFDSGKWKSLWYKWNEKGKDGVFIGLSGRRASKEAEKKVRRKWKEEKR